MPHVGEDTMQPRDSNLKLEVGKTYVDRYGERVEVIEEGFQKFLGDNGLYYQPSGRLSTHKTSQCDLVAELPAKQTETLTVSHYLLYDPVRGEISYDCYRIKDDWTTSLIPIKIGHHQIVVPIEASEPDLPISS